MFYPQGPTKSLQISTLSAATHHFGRYLWKDDIPSLGFPVLVICRQSGEAKCESTAEYKLGLLAASVNMAADRATSPPEVQRQISPL